ncbi:hypothetical protein Salat_2778200 [Sesamum alatum]|uniref:Uncharacterized protein n=1 Tax=Sesamum alatum TaxID=300844 RepID=A0AAE1XLL0_9LAMI|nr:hypothetical protein Salat_2778200 [Sesamum alatum]
MWGDHPDFLTTVEDRWNMNVEGTPQFSLCRKLKALKGAVKSFNNLHYSHISVRAKEADLALQDAQLQLESNPGMLLFMTRWGTLGRRRNAARNSILVVTNDDGSIITSAEDIDQEFIAFYTSLLGTEVQTLPVDDNVFRWDPKLSCKKSLRQRDTMSSAPFLLCMEYFSRLIKRKTSNSDFNFHSKCEKLKITHLFFSDNPMLFSRGIQTNELDSILVRIQFSRERCLSYTLAFPSRRNGFQSQISHRSSTGLEVVFANGWLSLFLLRAGWNSFAQLYKMWSVFSSKPSHYQWRSLRKSIDFVGFSSGTLRKHQLLGRKFVIPKKKAVFVSGTFNLRMLPSLPKFCGTFTVRQTRYGYSGSTRQQSNTWRDGLTSRDLRRPKHTTTSGQNSQGSLGKPQSGSIYPAEVLINLVAWTTGKTRYTRLTCVPTRESIMLVVHQH